MLSKYIFHTPGTPQVHGVIEDACIVIDQNGVSWREAKKALRAYYLQQAKSLRKLSEKEYFKNGN